MVEPGEAVGSGIGGGILVTTEGGVEEVFQSTEKRGRIRGIPRRRRRGRSSRRRGKSSEPEPVPEERPPITPKDPITPAPNFLQNIRRAPQVREEKKERRDIIKDIFSSRKKPPAQSSLTQAELTTLFSQQALGRESDRISGLSGDELFELSADPKKTGVVGMSVEGGSSFTFTPTQSQIKAARTEGKQQFADLPLSQRRTAQTAEQDVVLNRAIGNVIDIPREFAAGQSGTPVKDTPAFSERIPGIGSKIKEARSREVGLASQFLLEPVATAALGVPGFSPIRTAVPAGKISQKILASELDLLASKPFTRDQTGRITFLTDKGIESIETGAKQGDISEQIFVSGSKLRGSKVLTSTRVTTKVDEFGLFDDVPLTKGLNKVDRFTGIDDIKNIPAPTLFPGSLGIGAGTGINIAQSGARGTLVSGRGGDQVVLSVGKGFTRDIVGDLAQGGKIVSRGRGINIDLRSKDLDRGFSSFKGGSRPSRGLKLDLDTPVTFTTKVGNIKPPKISAPSSPPLRLEGGGAFAVLKKETSIFAGTGQFERTNEVLAFRPSGKTPALSAGFDFRDVELLSSKPGVAQIDFLGISEIPKSKTVFGSASGTRTRQGQATRQIPELKLDIPAFVETPKTTTGVFDFPGGGFGRGGGFFLPGFPAIGQPIPKKKRRKGRQRFKRTPSLGAALLGITAKKPRKGERTGLVERPIIV